nr:sorting nexin 2 [Hymenolepis microstoma]
MMVPEENVEQCANDLGLFPGDLNCRILFSDEHVNPSNNNSGSPPAVDAQLSTYEKNTIIVKVLNPEKVGEGIFLHRIINHPVLIKDTDVHEFLELESELPRGIGGQGISGASAIKLLKNVGEAVGKLTFRMDESDEYFDLKDEELAIWEVQGSRLYAALSNLVLDQTDLAASTLASSKALSVFANVEEHTGLARALGQLADTEEQIAHFLSVEAEVQSTFLVEYAKGVLSMIQACRDTLGERVRLFKTHRDCESALRGKREQKVRIEMSPKADRARIPILDREIGELTHKVEESEEDFEKISATIKKEFEHVDEARFEEFKAATLSYLTMILQMQEKTMTDDRPIGGGGGYKINWDEIDENTNPFGVGNAFGGNKLASSPPAGRAPPVQPDSTPASNIPVVSEDPLLNPSGKEVANEVRHVLDPSVTEFGDAKSVPKELKSHNKGPRPAPPKRTVSKGNSHEAEDKKESAVDSAKFENQIPNIVDIPPPEEFVPEETMTDDRPIGGGGGYKINWDEIDENTNPFGVGNAFGGNKLASSPPAGRAPPVQPDSTPASNIPVVSEDPLLNPSGKEVANEVRHVLDPSVTEFGDAKSVPKELKSHNKGPRPAPPKRTVSKGNSHEAEDKKESAVDSAKFENQIPNIVDIPPPEEFVPEETMTDDRPIGGGGGYKINWDEIDENTNPFGVGNAFGGNKLASSPPAGRAPPVQPDSTPASNIPVVSEDPLLNPSGKEVANEVRHVLDPSVTEFGDAKSVPKELKSHNKGPRPAPPKRTVSKGNSHEAEDKKESAVDSAKFENQIPNIVDIPPPEEFVPEEVRLLSLFSLIPISLVNPLIVLYLAKVANNITTAFALVALIAVSNMTSLSTKPQVGNPLVRGHSRRASNSSSATFDLVSGNQSPLPEPEPDRHSLSVDEELMNLRADKQHLTTVVADMQRCIAEYERSLRQLAEEKARAEESAKESVIDIIAERDQAIEEISTIEKAFGDLHRRFEKSKQIIEGFKTNEEALKKTAQEYQDQLKRQEQKYQSLKAHAEQQLTKVAEETERAKRANEDEVTRLRAAIKRSELRIHSLESQLQQKARSGTLI